MSSLKITREDKVTTVRLDRGKVHALNEGLVDELASRLNDLRDDTETKVVILTGTGKFFSFGFDIPELYGYSPEDFTRFVTKFCHLYTDLCLFPKLTIAAINGHAIAGGCILALACDFRMMATGRARIGLNEVTFGSSILAGTVEMLQSCVGNRNAETILTSGGLYSAEDALDFGLVDQASEIETLYEDTRGLAEICGEADSVAFGSLKKLLRGPLGERMARREPDSIKEFVEIWYSPSTRAQAKGITIR